MDLQQLQSQEFNRPRGDITTVLDQVSRDEQDNILFPLDAERTLFAANAERRVHPFSMSIQEFPYRGSAEWGGRFTFDLGAVGAGDMLLSVLVQVKLQHWLPPQILAGLRDGSITYADPSKQFVWANSLGTALIQSAQLEVGDQTLETVDGDFANVFAELFPDMNTQLGIATDALGRYPIVTGVTVPDFPTGPKGYITCILPFFFQRTRLKEAFPLLSIREGTVRVNIQFRAFNELVAKRPPYSRSSCDDTPVGETFVFNGGLDISGNLQKYTYTCLPEPPQPLDVRLVTYTAVLTGGLRQAYLRQPHEMLYRETQTFRFDEPLKYKVGKPSGDTVLIQLPLEANGPIEEILWFVRRKGAVLQNEWVNYSAVLAVEADPVYNPQNAQGLVVWGKIQANGIDLVTALGDYFRAHIAEKHHGGFVAFSDYIYGYSFARHPGEHQPSGSINVSRLNSLRLTLEVAQPVPADDWEVVVYCMGLNWVRFENGIVNRVYAD